MDKIVYNYIHDVPKGYLTDIECEMNEVYVVKDEEPVAFFKDSAGYTFPFYDRRNHPKIRLRLLTGKVL